MVPRILAWVLGPARGWSPSTDAYRPRFRPATRGNARPACIFWLWSAATRRRFLDYRNPPRPRHAPTQHALAAFARIPYPDTHNARRHACAGTQPLTEHLHAGLAANEHARASRRTPGPADSSSGRLHGRAHLFAPAAGRGLSR